MRQIPPAGINLFQLIYILIREYTQKTGLPPLNLSLGNPDGIPPQAIRELKARFALDPGFAYHTYAEDTNLHGFAEAMVELHGRIRTEDYPHLKALPIPGIKTASALIPLACGLHLPDKKRRERFRVASNLPAYDVIGTWSDGYLGAERVVWPLSTEDNMRLSLARLKDALAARKLERVDLVFTIRPGNPASVGAKPEEWKELIEWCLERKTRLVNDAAYSGLADERHTPLAAVAKDYPELEWLELYSVSKTFNDPGARLGALVGSRDFVEDFILVKGNTESGPVPGVMAAYGEFFKDRAVARKAMDDLRGLYERRLAYVIPRLRVAGLQPACTTEAGFFTLWKAPRRALGRDFSKETAPHEAFNRAVISETGIVGVHFLSPGPAGSAQPLIRYAVCTDVLDPGFQKRFEEQLERLKPAYA
ncbi:MAG TPA: pyridoxal phosphate-dependent aminotransferase [Elusimicrobiota bacterium]|jgi:aspartate/methionine/tyrosine aminotransferase|nr:pyridoxal phosphate-dependent aminotransferase [Elusimicrobiota bacterium]